MSYTPSGYDGRVNLYNVSGSSLAALRRDLAKSVQGTAPFRFAFLGDSTTFGFSAVKGTTDYPTQTIGLLGSKSYAVGGSGPVISSTVDPRVTVGTGWSAFSNALMRSATAGSLLTFAPTLTGEIVDITYYNSGNGGTFTYSVDGAAAVAVTTSSGSVFVTVSVTGLANTAHSIVITQTNASNTFIHAVGTRRANGVTVGNYGYSNSKAFDWQPVANGGNPYDYFPSLLSFGPTVTLLDLSVNDNATATATYATQMQNIITGLVTAGSAVILVTPMPPGAPYSTNLTARIGVLYSLANTNNLPLIDLYDRWGSSNATIQSAGLMSDAVHPNAIGYQDKARAILNILGI